MTLPKLPSVADIHSRLERLFTPGLEMRKNLVREMAAKTVFVFLYGGMVDGADRCLRPSHVYFFTEDQAQKTSDEDRLLWLAQSRSACSRRARSRSVILATCTIPDAACIDTISSSSGSASRSAWR